MSRFVVMALALTWLALALARPALVSAQGAPCVDWPRVDAETLTHYQALLRMDTSDRRETNAPLRTT